jgi:nucleotide-binding universal stress UspA family protein
MHWRGGMLNFLLAVDGSQAALRATVALIEAARLYRDPVHVDLVTVHLPVPRVGAFFDTVVSKDMVEQYYRDEGKQAIQSSERMLTEAGIAFNAHILVGSIAETIVAHGDAAQCRMIYMGTRGMGAVANMVMGSIATKVVHLALTPVVLVH